ncbi:MAG: penicillin-binding transpeptidase domain-containing protein, partial [Patescibacteria group bacterium]
MKIGAAFPDYIRTERIERRGRNFFGKTYSSRVYLLPLFLIIFTALIIIRLFFLQIFQGSYYRNLSDLNRTRTIAIHAPRGIIFDRNQTPLVFNVPGYREVLKDEASIAGVKTRLIDNNKAMKLISDGKNNLEIDSLRSYPYKDFSSHAIGYIGQISKEELSRKEFSSYKGGELIGKIGVEGWYESMLAGRDGKELIEIDSHGRIVRELGKTDPTAGENITLTIDIELQKAVFDAALDIKKGAVIVSSPKGEILALVSKPSFDPNLFTQGENYSGAPESPYKSISEILGDDVGQPLLNRAIGGVYPPGSTFKLITAAAALVEKKIDQDFKIEDTGVLTIGPFSFASWYYSDYGRKEGSLNVVSALKRSNDIFFYKTSELVGVEKISEVARKFGLGKTLGIDLIGEQKGLVPTPLWKEKEIGEKWFLGDTYHYGIGQGYLLTTPLQVNAWTQVIANGGTLYQPHL